ncbi:MAG: dihydrodipicolinate synthase family protein [Candidatus Latescibacteria bacterium]|nr:dihydrodipicolinate synthase family protein [Candidatus Latescibacterota bacterium]
MMRIDDAVITAQVLEQKAAGAKEVEIDPKATLTPSAQDYLRANQVQIVRQPAGLGSPPAAADTRPAPSAAKDSGKRKFKGIFCPNMVIFDQDQKINYNEMERYIEWLIEAGIHGLYPNGSSGEFVRLSLEERKDVVRLITSVNQDRVPILAGASEANVRDVLEITEFYAGIGVHAISLVPPYYYKISDRSMYEYFAEIARQSALDILLYNIPQFTQELSLDIMEELLAFERIFGTKDSSRDLPRLSNTIHRLRAQRPDYVVLNGCEENLLPSVIMGASGGTIATSSIIPEIIIDLYESSVRGDIERARMLQFRILDLINLMLLGVNFPEGFKTAVGVRGFDMGPPRQIMSEEEREHLLKLEAQISCILADMGYEVRGPRACPVTNLSPIVGR